MNVYTDVRHFPPVAEINDRLCIFTAQQWFPFKVLRRFWLPESPPMRNDFGAVAASATIAVGTIANFQLTNNQLAQLRYEPVDDLEVELYQLSANPQNTLRSVHATVTRQTRLHDPLLETSEHYYIGFNGSPGYLIRNRTAYARSRSIVQFWGYRYDVEQLQGVTVLEDATGRYLVTTTTDQKGQQRVIPAKWIMAEATQTT